jgi:hypothetical protein
MCQLRLDGFDLLEANKKPKTNTKKISFQFLIPGSQLV